MTARVLRLEGLRVETSGAKSVPLLHGLTLDVVQGRVLALVGASGSGKSTACSAALGVLAPELLLRHGHVQLDGQPIPAAALRGRVVASVLQNPRSGFNPLRTMAEHVRETLTALNLSWCRPQVIATFQDVGLEAPERVLELYAFEMSGGMLQRVAIALALLSGAPFLFADEPTSDLDLVSQARVLDLLAWAQQSRGLGVLLITHDMGVVARLADDVAVLDAGRVVEQGPVERLFQAPEHPVTRNLIKAHLALYGQELHP